MCDFINCSLTIDEERKEAIITDLQDEDVKIDLSSDVDFTDLVSILTQLIDEQKKINLTINQELSDDKLKLISKTIQEIFQIYNENMKLSTEIEPDGMDSST